MWDSAIWYSPLVHAPFFTCLSVVVFSFFLCVCVHLVVVVFPSFPLLFPTFLVGRAFFPNRICSSVGARVGLCTWAFRWICAGRMRGAPHSTSSQVSENEAASRCVSIWRDFQVPNSWGWRKECHWRVAFVFDW